MYLFAKSIEAVLILFILLFIGWFSAKKGWMRDEEKDFLNKIIVIFCIPALTIDNLFGSFNRAFIISSINYLFVALIFFISIMIIVRLITIVFKIDRSKVGTFIAMSAVSNSIFFGLPINLSLYGEESIQYILCYYMINTTIFWAICSPMIKKEGNIKNKDSLGTTLKNVFNIPFLTIIITAFLIYNNISLPNVILKVSQHLSKMVTPLACMVIGKIIYDIDFKEFKIDYSIIGVVIMRFIIAPILMFAITRLFGMPTIVTKVFTIMSAMPIMMQVAIISDMSGGDSKKVASAIALTTLLTLLTTPIYAIIMDILL